ncbi:MAG: hypothetical protein AAFX94_04210, partial [Myxococcota bacterium]
ASPPAVTPASSAPAELEAYVDRSRVRPGDKVTFRLVLERDASVEVRMAPPGDDLGQLTVIERGQVKEEPYPGRLRTVFWYEVEPSQAQVYELPTFQATYAVDGKPVELTTRTVFIEATDEPPTGEDDLKDIRVPGAPQPLAPWLYGGLASLLVVALLLFWLRRKKSGVAPLEKEPPETRVRRRLAEIARIDVTVSDGARRFCFELTEALKDYLESLCDINASDLTTQEIARAIQHTWLTVAVRDEFVQVLTAADRVKFAGDATSAEALERLHRIALHFVDHAHRDPSVEAAS